MHISTQILFVVSLLYLVAAFIDYHWFNSAIVCKFNKQIQQLKTIIFLAWIINAIIHIIYFEN